MSDLRPYITDKPINAKPMTLGEYNAGRGWSNLEGQCPESEGYAISYSIDQDNIFGLTFLNKEAFDRIFKQVEECPGAQAVS